MKRSILSTVLVSALVSSVAFANGLELAGEKVKFSKRLSLQKLVSLDSQSDNISVIVKTKKSLGKSEIDKLYIAGAKAIEYAGPNSYYILSDKENIENILKRVKGFEGIAILDKKYKIAHELKNININDTVKINIDFLKNISKNEFERKLLENGIEFENIKMDGEFKRATITIFGIDLEKIASFPEVKYIYKFHKIGAIKAFSNSIGTEDLDTAEKTNADKVWTGNLNLDGLNIKVGVVDEGRARISHQEFKLGRVSKIKNRVVKGELSLHTTHICGIIASNGIKQIAKGMAPSTKIYNYSYEDFYFANAISKAYSHDRVLVSNHSYGFTDNVDTGVYNSDAANIDRLIHSNPYLNVFIAAGNDRTRSGYSDIGIIKGAANAKNILTIGALDSMSNSEAYYSSTGPVRDGRIKPDLCVKGSSVYSTSSSGDSSYAYMSGTSMATPAATGLATLVMQEYKNLTDCGQGRGCDMRHDLLKSILINTAVDKSNPGPDVYTGFGMIDVEKAVKVVDTLKDRYQKFTTSSIARGGKREYTFTIYDNKKFSATISWVDPAGNSANSGKTLVNDIDMYLIRADENGPKYYPYVLNQSNYKAPAKKAENHIDNVEKIEVDNLPAGTYKLVVSGTHLQTNSQEYAIVASEEIFNNNIKRKEQININNFAKVIMKSIY